MPGLNSEVGARSALFKSSYNNIYYLQLGYHPVAVVILHVHKYGKKKKVTRKFKSGGLHERHVVATWKLVIVLCYRLSVVIVLCCYLCCSVIIVLFYVLIVCTVTLPPGVNPIAVDKYIISYIK